MSFKVENVNKSFGSEKVLQSVSFTLRERKCLSVVGKSGSGKTTLLKILAGLEKADSAQIYWHDQALHHLESKKRGVVYLYQEALLFPYLNVFENIAFGLRIQKNANAVIENRTQQMLLDLGLEGMAQKMPHQLSGGQKQRVAFGRALIVHPRVLLLDEPFGALDAQTRTVMQQLFLKISTQEKITSLFVTHDPKEALVVGNQLALMQEGKLKVFNSEREFINDSHTGLQKEIAFWQGLLEGQKMKT